MAVLATDDFNRADSSDLGASWDVMPGTSPGFSIVSNVILPTNNSDDRAETNNSVTWPNDQYSEVTYSATGSGGVGTGMGPACRASNAAITMYRAVGSASGYELGRFVAGAFTSLSSGSGTTFTNGDTLRLDVSGSGDWKLYKNGSQFASGTDGSPIASGRAGVAYSSADSTIRVTSWAGGDGVGSGGGGGAVTGTGAATIAIPTVAGTATRGVSDLGGAIAISISIPTVSGTGTVTPFVPGSSITGTGALTISMPTVSGTARRGAHGTGSLTITMPLVSGAAVRHISGTGALSIHVPIVSGTDAAGVSGAPVGRFASDGSLNIVVNPVTGSGLYTPKGYLRVSTADASSGIYAITGGYRAEISSNEAAPASGVGLFNLSGGYRMTSAGSAYFGTSGVYALDGSLRVTVNIEE